MFEVEYCSRDTIKQSDSYGWIWTSGLTSTALLENVRCVASGNAAFFHCKGYLAAAQNTPMCVCRQIQKDNRYLMENTHQLVCLQLTMQILVVTLKLYALPDSSKQEG